MRERSSHLNCSLRSLGPQAFSNTKLLQSTSAEYVLHSLGSSHELAIGSSLSRQEAVDTQNGGDCLSNDPDGVHVDLAWFTPATA